MLSAADNEMITRVGPGTPMGEVFRCFWLPILCGDDLERDGAPVRLRILGENLIGFRDSRGTVGVLQAACPHRRAKLFWGRNEDCGLRCAYHGWKFDVTGQCVDMPSEPADSTFKDRIRAHSYEALERGGLVWLYMGPGGTPEFPSYPWLEAGEGQLQGTTWLQRSNWLQSLEGDFDSAHVSFLHRWLDATAGPPAFIDGYRRFVEADTAPHLAVVETPYGLQYGGRRTVSEGEYYWRTTHWVAPAASQVAGGGGMRFLTPIDDHHSISCSVRSRDRSSVEALSPFALPDGYIVDVRQPDRGPENDFRIDRDAQRSTTFSGIPGGARDQDRAMTETMEPVLDRSDEHLGTTDVAIIAMRRQLLSLARDLERGIEPPMAGDPDAVRTAVGFNVVSKNADFADVLAEVAGDKQPGRGESRTLA
jgi:phenylpropionate dioxygenase-like ring-hydroxylating dioxygenase large terminal subunit